MAVVSLDDDDVLPDDDVLLLELVVPEAALVDETAPLLSLAVVLVGATPFCWAAAWKSVARNC